MSFSKSEIERFLVESRMKQGLPAQLTDEERERIVGGFARCGFNLVDDMPPIARFEAA